MHAVATRGFGFLEHKLADKRYAVARSLIGPLQARNRILDIGCGNPPLFLAQIDFKEKYGIDSNIGSPAMEGGPISGIVTHSFDITRMRRFPYRDDFFDCITMLAFIEHIPAGVMGSLGADMHRILKPSGRLVITTPSAWTHALLRGMAKVHLVSAVEINNHSAVYTARNIILLLSSFGFSPEKIKQGHFELFCNQWVTAEK
ncbi:MAG: class I SAM-dependent methyltransferase [Chitinivibrionales bacterium]|nr:class I SAM-dependent methyltransferase [Chitinivibrionales bacterium]